MAENEDIPFTEGAPPDDLQVEVIGDDVLIGDPDSDLPPETDSSFDDNLAEEIDQKILDRVGSHLMGYYNNDREARSEWETVTSLG